MKPSFVALLGAGLLFLAAPAGGRDDPLVNPSNVPIAWGHPREPTLDEIGRGIVTGCARRLWQCSITRPGQVRAVLMVRQHMAEARIDYDTKTLSVTYVDSRELRYDAKRNEIHRKYNLWVTNLIGDINRSIASLP